ncbi:MAG: dUTP diphosphatase [Bilifractor sp.]|jgi:dUTP pyrophosphatase
MFDSLNLKYVLDKGAYAPERAHKDDAGIDLRTPERVVIRKGESVSIDTGVHVQIPKGWFGKLESKSGLNVKSGIVSLGGVIDSGYTGSIVVKLYNFGGNYHVFEAGDKIVQMVVQPCFTGDLIEVDELSKTERGSGGFGSTGK